MFQVFPRTIFNSLKKSYSISLARNNLQNLPDLKKTYMIIVMSGGVHLAYLATRFIPDSYDTVIVMNGVTAWESAWLRRRVAAAHYVEIPMPLVHADVLDLLLDTMPGDFGIVDYDCYVMKDWLFSKMSEITDGCAANALFFRHNPELNLDVPETFFLYFNTKIINNIRRKYGVGASALKWMDLPEKARSALSTIGFGENCLPELHKPYFDTLRALMMLARVEGVSYQFVDRLPATPTPSEIAFHVGGVSNPKNVNGIWDYRGSYFWYRVLEQIDDEELQRFYFQKFPRTTAKKLLERQYELGLEIQKDFLDYCEDLISTVLAR